LKTVTFSHLFCRYPAAALIPTTDKIDSSLTVSNSTNLIARVFRYRKQLGTSNMQVSLTLHDAAVEKKYKHEQIDRNRCMKNA
jgi:hypothetical protein